MDQTAKEAFLERRAEKQREKDEEFAKLNSYERVIYVLEGELENLRRHANFERYGTRDGDHPPMKPEDAPRYSQFLQLQMSMALEGKRVPRNHFRITKDQGWIYDPPQK